MKRYIPLLLLVLAVAYVASTLLPRTHESEFDLKGFSRLPVLVNGRIKPLDTVAGTSILMMQGRQRIVTPDQRSLQPSEWLADVLFAPDKADNYRVFLVENHEVLDVLKLKPEDGDGNKRFSYEQLRPGMTELEHQAQLAQKVEAALRSPFQKQVISVFDRAILYIRLKNSAQLADQSNFFASLQKFEKDLPAGIEAMNQHQAGGASGNATLLHTLSDMRQRFAYMERAAYLNIIPPAPSDPDSNNWITAGSALLRSFETGRLNPNALAYAALGETWRTGKAEQFNEIVKLYREQLAERFVSQLTKSDAEARFNSAEPFYTSMVLYVLAFLIAVFSWLRWPEALGRGAYYLLALAFILTTVGIATRMWLEGRPPVTNLYSSALFVGWGAVGLCVILEKIYRNAIGSVAGGLIGFIALLIAHHLSKGGDTLEMMRAVLDSNFWLATHVVTITIGYSAVFLAGFLAIIYIARGVFTKSLDKGTADALTRMVYGIICFATLFSLVGTVLGGIWADQSWGRFWGWDPKENGALLIVIWCAVILHARWGGLIRQRGLMVLAIFGNIVTAWSWFGVNMLGVGLHSYGFMDSAFWWLVLFAVSQLSIMALAGLPREKWRSFQGR